MVGGREEGVVQLGARKGRVPERRDVVRGGGGRRRRGAPADGLGCVGKLVAGWEEAGVHAAPLGVVAEALSRRVRGGPLGLRYGGKELREDQRPGRLQG